MKDRNLNHSDNWATPKEFYDELNKEFDFDFDPCPLMDSNNITPDKDGLIIEWGERNYINPPYSKNLKEAFVKKAIEESKKGKLCVMLLPVSTSTKLFHEHILPNADDIRFVKGRIKFLGTNTKGEFVTNKTPMHDSMIVVFKPKKQKPMFSEENKVLNISDVRSSNYSIVDKEGLYKIMHEQFATDRYQYGTTLVSASSKEEAMKKLNEYLYTEPDGVYTALPCKDIEHVWVLKVLE